jgi:ornithine carbamoyltransferase
MSATEVQLGKRESVADVSRTISGYLHGIIIRTFEHETLETFAKYSSVPVINGLTDMYHPAQVLSDYYTIARKKGEPKKLKIVYIGDGNNMCHSLMHGIAILGGTLVIAGPKGYEPDATVSAEVEKLAQKTKAQIQIMHDPNEAVKNADVVYTDVWTSMGDEAEAEERLNKFKSFQVNDTLMSHAKSDCLVMHCLPAHRGEEITDSVVESKQSIVFEQAQNRLYVQQALMVEIFGNKK